VAGSHIHQNSNHSYYIMNILLSCVGKRSYIVEYFKHAMRGCGKIIGTSNTAWTPAFQDCDESVILPPIGSEDYIPSVMETCRRYDVKGLLSFFDPDVFALSSHLTEFHAIGVVPVVPNYKAAIIAYDKLQTFSYLRDHSFLVPETTSEEGVALEWLKSGRFQFPLVVKPRCGYGSINTFVANTTNELNAFYSYGKDMIIQQFVTGEAFNVDGLGSLEGMPLVIVPWKKLLSRHGETERSVTVNFPELEELGAKLIEQVGIVGPFDGDFFVTNEGAICVLELNLRFGGGYPVSHLAGANFPELILRMIEGGEVIPVRGQHKVGVTMMKRLQVIAGPEHC